MAAAREANRYVEENAPWKLIKEDRERCATVLYTAIAAISGSRPPSTRTCRSPARALHGYLGNEGPRRGRRLALRRPAAGPAAGRAAAAVQEARPVDHRRGRGQARAREPCSSIPTATSRTRSSTHDLDAGARARARDAGVTAMVVVGYDMASSRRGDRDRRLPRETSSPRSASTRTTRRTLRPSDIDELASAGGLGEGRGDRRDRPRLLPQPLAAGRPGARVPRAARPGAAPQPAGGHPLPRRRRRDVRDPRRVRGAGARPTGRRTGRWASCTATPATCRWPCATSSSAS